MIEIRSIAGQKTWKECGLSDLRDTPLRFRYEAPSIFEQADSVERAVAMLQQSIGLDKIVGSIAVATPIEIVTITTGNLFHLVEKRDNARERYANYILPTLQSPFEIWCTEYSDGNPRNRYIGLFTGKVDIAIIVKVEANGRIMWNIMNADRGRMNKFREGLLLWSK